MNEYVVAEPKHQANAAAAHLGYNDPGILMKFIGSLAVSSTAGTYIIGGVDFMDFATSVTGGLGAAAGYTAGCYLASGPADKSAVTKLKDDMSMDYKMLYPIAGAVAVPALASGRMDTDIAILAAGAWAGGYLVSYYYSQN